MEGMKIMKKRLMLCLAMLCCLFTNAPNIRANDVEADEEYTVKTDEEYIEEFKNVIESSSEYKKLESDVKGIFVEVVNEDEKITVVYGLDDSENPTETLVFVGNKDMQFEQVLKIKQSETSAEVSDLLESLRTRIHIGNCVEDKCVSSIPFRYDPAPGCSAVVGQACKSLSLLPGYGKITYLLCRGGVFVTCNFSLEKKCIKYSHIEYECRIM